MRTLIATVVLLVAAVLVLGLALFPAGCGSRATPLKPSPPSPPAAQPPEVSPDKVVTSYLEALDGKHYETAYALLSQKSQQQHSYGDFVAQVEKTGVTEYDLGTAQVTGEGADDGTATVGLQLKEDVATASFSLAKEAAGWRIVYREGTPSFPYP